MTPNQYVPDALVQHISIPKPVTGHHLVAPLSHFFLNKYYIIHSGVLFYTPYSALSCCSGNNSIQMLIAVTKISCKTQLCQKRFGFLLESGLYIFLLYDRFIFSVL